MAKIKGTGAPTIKTKGAIGDIYTDVTTGRKYKCTNAYGVGGDFDYTWRLQVTEKAAPVKEENKVEVKSEPAVEVTVVAEEPIKESKKSQKKVEKETVDEQTEAAPKRFDYAAVYDKQSK